MKKNARSRDRRTKNARAAATRRARRCPGAPRRPKPAAVRAAPVAAAELRTSVWSFDTGPAVPPEATSLSFEPTLAFRR